jgi:hypothetical protein
VLVRRSGEPARNRRRPGPLIAVMATVVVFVVACLLEPGAARAIGYALTAAAAAVAMANGGLQLLDRWGSQPGPQPGQDGGGGGATGGGPDRPDSSGRVHDREERTSG